MATIIEGGVKGIEHAAKQRKGRFIPGLFLFLGAGQTAKIRFLTDEPKILSAEYHTVEDASGNAHPEICGFAVGDDDCEPCTNIALGLTKVRRLYNLYIWLYSITDEKGMVININEPRVWRTGPGKGNYIMNSVVSFAQKYTTLCDRAYDLKRTGKGPDDTVYSLMPDDKSPVEPEIVKVSAKLPPLQTVITGGEFEWSWGKKQEQQPATSSATGSALLKRLRGKKPAAEAGEAL